MIGEERMNYPDNHIESDNRLSWMLGRLNAKFGDEPYYVHLSREPMAVARSYNRRWGKPWSIMKAYRNGIYMCHKEPDSVDWAVDYIETVTENIRHFLQDKTKVMTIDIADIDKQFPIFLDWIGAEGDLEAANAEWHVSHNSTNPSLKNFVKDLKESFTRSS